MSASSPSMVSAATFDHPRELPPQRTGEQPGACPRMCVPTSDHPGEPSPERAGEESAPSTPTCAPTSDLPGETERADEQSTIATTCIQKRKNEETQSHASFHNGDFESKMRNIRKLSCVTTNSALMVITWTIASVSFSGISAYWLSVTVPVLRHYEYVIPTYYHASAALVIVLLLSPLFAVAGDVRYGNYNMMFYGAAIFNVIGLGILAVLAGAYVYFKEIAIVHSMVIGYFFTFLAGGIFQANVIQFGSDVLGDADSPERSAFVHWYYWATYVPTFAATIILYCTHMVLSDSLLYALSITLGIGMAALLLFLLANCGLHCAYLKSARKWNILLPRVSGNPVAQVVRVTRYALQSPTSPAHRGFFARFSKICQSNGGPADDQEVDNVAKFWLLVLLIASLYGFFFYDDMWAVPFAKTLNSTNSNPIIQSLSSQTTNSVIVFVSVPIYQLVVRPLLGKHVPPLLWRIPIGLIMQLVSLALVMWNVGAADLPDTEVCDHVSGYDSDHDFEIGIDWFILAIPQAINGLSQLLVFPAVIELILVRAPRIMQGLLIGLWYSMHSIHIIVGVFETATCAVFYWKYYIMKIVLVTTSIVLFLIMAFLSRPRKVMYNRHLTQSQVEMNVLANPGV